MNRVCNIGDTLCSCKYCYNQCIKKSFQDKYTSPKELIVGPGIISDEITQDRPDNPIYRHHAGHTSSANKVTLSEATWDAKIANPVIDDKAVYRHKQVLDARDDELAVPTSNISSKSRLKGSRSKNRSSRRNKSNSSSMIQMLRKGDRQIEITQWVDSCDEDTATDNDSYDEDEEKDILLHDFGYASSVKSPTPNMIPKYPSLLQPPNIREKRKKSWSKSRKKGIQKQRQKQRKNGLKTQYDLVQNQRGLLCGESIMEFPDKWLKLNADQFKIRPKEYYSGDGKKRKGVKKVASKEAMYEVFAVDAYRMNEKLKFNEMMEKYDIDLSNVIQTDTSQSSYLPQLIIVNVILPINSSSKNINDSTTNGIQSHSMLNYLMTVKRLWMILKMEDHDDELPESMSLFSKFIHSVNNDRNKRKTEDKG